MFPGAKCPSWEAVREETRAALLGLDPDLAEPEEDFAGSAGVGGAAAVGKADESATG